MKIYIEALIQRMRRSKAIRFWASWQVGEGDYLAIREQLFAKETVSSLYKQIEQFQGKQKKK